MWTPCACNAGSSLIVDRLRGLLVRLAERIDEEADRYGDGLHTYPACRAYDRRATGSPSMPRTC